MKNKPSTVLLVCKYHCLRCLKHSGRTTHLGGLYITEVTHAVTELKQVVHLTLASVNKEVTYLFIFKKS